MSATSARGPRILAPALAGCLLGLCALASACKSSEAPSSTGPQSGAGGTGDNAGGASGTGGTGGPSGGTGGSTSKGSDGGAREDSGSQGGAGGTGGSGGATGGTGGSSASDAGDAPVERPASSDGGGAEVIPDSDHLPGRPDIRLCKKEWTMEQCCAFLCSCLGTICSDSPKAKPGIANCMSWCPKISNMAARCHVYHCYVSISPTGGIKDHDSHCGHAANQVAGGGCPTVVYQ